MIKIFLFIFCFFIMSCSTIDKGIGLYTTAKKIIPVMKQSIQNDPQLDSAVKEQCLMWISKYEQLFKQ